MKTLSQANNLISQGRNIFDNINLGGTFKVAIALKWDNKKGRERAKENGFRFNANNKMWEKETDTIHRNLVVNISDSENIFLKEI